MNIIYLSNAINKIRRSRILVARENIAASLSEVEPSSELAMEMARLVEKMDTRIRRIKI